MFSSERNHANILFKLHNQIQCIPGEAHPHQEWGCASPGMHIIIGNGMCLTGNGDVPHREWGCASSGIGMRLNGNAYPHREQECDSLGMHILTGNKNAPHWECISPPGMGMCLTGNAYPQPECISSPGMHIVYTG